MFSFLFVKIVAEGKKLEKKQFETYAHAVPLRFFIFLILSESFSEVDRISQKVINTLITINEIK